MWHLEAPWWEFVLRGLIVYGALLILMRMSGKRQIGQLTPFDLVLLLIISNAVQNAMNAGDNSVAAGLILAVTLFAADAGLGYVTWLSRRAESFLEGKPQILIHDGKVYDEVMRRERISQHELHKTLRRAGCEHLQQVHVAILETDGSVSVMKRETLPPDRQGPGSLWRDPGGSGLDAPV